MRSGSNALSNTQQADATPADRLERGKLFQGDDTHCGRHLCWSCCSGNCWFLRYAP
ncbi:hypothetical protein OK016_26895 [Vibrio chagasii]|nr:hypothetical protein [Vibrio chagasii]